MTERATTDANDAGDPATLDWLPERAIGIGRALVPVLAAFGRDEATAELARLAGGFAADPPIVGVQAVAASFGLNSAVRECTNEQLTTISTPFVAILGDHPVGVGPHSERPIAPNVTSFPVITFEPGREFIRAESAIGNCGSRGPGCCWPSRRECCWRCPVCWSPGWRRRSSTNT